MDKFGRGLRLVAALAALGLTCSVSHADDSAPPPHGSSLGIATSRLSDTWREKNAYRSSGILVVGVDPSGRAAKGGITPGDVLVSVDGRTLREPSDLGYAERGMKADRAVPVVLAKDGGHSIKMFDLGPIAANESAAPPVVTSTSAALSPVATSDGASPPVATSESAAIPASVIIDPAPSAAASEPAAGAAIIIARGASAETDSAGPVATAVVPDSAPAEAFHADTVELGVHGQPLTPELAVAVGAAGVEGVLVLEVSKESPASHAGVKPGDVIFKIGDQPVKDVESMDKAVAASTSPISISMLRLGKQQVVLAPFGETPDDTPPADQQQQLNQLKDEVKSLHKEVADLRAQLAKLLDSNK